MKTILTVSLLLILNSISYAQNKTFHIKGNIYRVLVDTLNTGNQGEKEIYQVVRMKNDSTILSSLEVDKHYVNDNTEYSTRFQYLNTDHVFAFVHTLVQNNDTTHTITRVYLDSHGNPFTNIKYRRISSTGPRLGNHMPVFMGGRRALRRWIGTHINSAKILRAAKAEQLRLVVAFTIDEDGKPVIGRVMGTNNPVVKQMIKNEFSSMPHWIPRLKNSRHVSARLNLPLNLKK